MQRSFLQATIVATPRLPLLSFGRVGIGPAKGERRRSGAQALDLAHAEHTDHPHFGARAHMAPPPECRRDHPEEFGLRPAESGRLRRDLPVGRAGDRRAGWPSIPPRGASSSTTSPIARSSTQVHRGPGHRLRGAVIHEARGATKSLSSSRLSAGKLAGVEEERAPACRSASTRSSRFDFCHAPGREAAAGILTAMTRTLAERRGAIPGRDPLAPAARPKGAIWVARTGVHVDRIASSWLIQRFIDPEARLKFVPGKGYVPEPGEVRFDMYDAEFTHVGEPLHVRGAGREDGARGSGAHGPWRNLIHDIDLRDGKYARDETAGVQKHGHRDLLGARERPRADRSGDRRARGSLRLLFLEARTPTSKR